MQHIKEIIFSLSTAAVFIAGSIPAITTSPQISKPVEHIETVEEITEAVTEQPKEETTEATVYERETPYTIQHLGEFEVTAYCGCSDCCGAWGEDRPTDEDGRPIIYTASGARAEQGVTVAADTDVFPFGTELVINGNTYTVQDVGGAIEGNRIDIYFDNHQSAVTFGRRWLDVSKVVNE